MKEGDHYFLKVFAAASKRSRIKDSYQSFSTSQFSLVGALHFYQNNLSISYQSSHINPHPHPQPYKLTPLAPPALRLYYASHPTSSTTFSIKYLPYQLYPEASKEGEDKYEWYKKSKYGDSEEKMKMYTTLMTSYGQTAGIEFQFGGTVANTLDAHRIIQHFQEERGQECAGKIVDSLYAQYFTASLHPSAASTLLTATTSAGIPASTAEPMIADEYEGLQEVKMLIKEQEANGVDSVPYVVVEGRRRDFTLEGAREVGEYLKALEQVDKESG
ncbi:MAG: hypothetical protein M1827_004140 [Pycnora praestabilis]|nr:MAG: hypothetical protein M1827_004140 [Pycnora praestabilis]